MLQIREHLGYRGHLANPPPLGSRPRARNPLDITGARP
jgi:hypothetical protein